VRGLFFAEREGGDVGGQGVDDVCLMCFFFFCRLAYARTMTSNARVSQPISDIMNASCYWTDSSATPH